MKKILLLIPALALLSCEKEVQNDNPADQENSKATLTVNIVPENLSKANGPAHGVQETDNTVNTLDILIFRNDESAALEDIRTFSKNELSQGLTGLKVETTSGDKQIHVIANAHKDSWNGINNLTDYSKIVASVKNDSAGDFIMTGSANVTIGASTVLSLSISRLVARICIDKVSTDFANTSLEGKTLQQVKMYLINMKGSKSVKDNTDPVGEVFLNRRRYIPSDIQGAAEPEMFYESIPGAIDQTGHTTPHYFYCFENEVTGHTEIAPATKLVIEAKIDGITYYYPVEINQNRFGYKPETQHHGVKNNHSYTMSVVIKRLGSDDPDKPLQYGTVEIGLEIADWITVPHANITF